MENLFSLEYGIGGICVLLTLQVLFRVGEFLWKLKEKKETLSENAITALTKAVQDCTLATQLLEHRLKTLEGALTELPKLKTDLQRSFSALKILAGEKWQTIRDEILKDGLTV